jgi:pyroglutamyl-peptidase
MKILLTGFGPFGKVISNPSARLVEHFQSAGLTGHTLTAAVLPVSYRRAGEEIARLLTEGTYDLAILMGVANGSEMIRLEIFGRNRSSVRKKDADEEVTGGTVRCDGPGMLSAGLSTAGIVRKLSAEGIASRISRSAGDYVCNHTYYSALDAIRENKLSTRCLFIHVPSDEATMESPYAGPVMPFAVQVRAVERILVEFAAR